MGILLNTAEGLLRDIMERIVENQICNELRDVMESAKSFLEFAKETLDEYDPSTNIPPNPLILESSLQVPDSVEILDLKDVDTQFGRWFQTAIRESADYLGALAWDPRTGRNDLKANILLRDYLLENGALIIGRNSFPRDGIIYQGHDAVTETEIRLDSVRLVGLDSLTRFDPLTAVGRYTLQNQIEWEYLAFEMKATIDIKPSTLPDSIIEGSGNTRIVEEVDVFFGINDLIADVSLLTAFKQNLLEDIKLGSLLQQENMMSCLLSTLFKMEFSTLSVEASDILSPNIDGFVSKGLDRVFSDAIETGFLLYEKILLRASPAFSDTHPGAPSQTSSPPSGFAS